MSSEGDLSYEAEESSSEGDSEENEFNFNEDWGAAEHYTFKHAQFFDLANQQPPAPVPTGGDSETEDSQSQMSAEEEVEEYDSEDEDEYDDYFNQNPVRAPARRPREAQAPREAQGRGLGGRRTGRHPTNPRRRRQQQQPSTYHRQPLHRVDPHAQQTDPHVQPDAHEPVHASPHSTETLAAQPTQRHDRHAPPPSARRHRVQRPQRDAVPGGKQKQGKGQGGGGGYKPS